MSIDTSGTAILGSNLTLEVGDAAPSSVVAHYFALSYGLGQLGACEFYLQVPSLLEVGATDAQGSASLTLAVPKNPALAGLDLWFQSAVVDLGGALFGVGALPRLWKWSWEADPRGAKTRGRASRRESVLAAVLHGAARLRN